MKIKNLNTVMHYFANQFIQPNTLVIDATCGNGNDTYFLAKNFPNQIISVDIQHEAIINTKKRCAAFSNIKYYQIDHQNIYQIINQSISFAVFNLGFLPYANNNITTKASTTIKAIDTILNNLISGGGICISVYTNHDLHKESHNLQDYVKTLDKNQFLVLEYKFLNLNNPPYLIIIEKK